MNATTFGTHSHTELIASDSWRNSNTLTADDMKNKQTNHFVVVLIIPVRFQEARAIDSQLPLLSQCSSKFIFSEIFLTTHDIALPVI
jgi:hypothetical protein